jgi:uncharacterized OB-fold protein
MSVGNKDRKFIEDRWFQGFGDDIRLMGTRCETCGFTSFPSRPVCSCCGGETLKDVPISKTGTLHTYARSVMGPTDMEKPYVLGFIDLPEGIRIYSLITDCDYERLKVGMPMEMLIGSVKKDESGNDICSYMFRPTKEEK